MLQEAATCSTAVLPVISLVGSSIEVDTRFGQSGSKYTSASANQVRGNFNAIAAKFSATAVNSFSSTSRDRNVGRKKHTAMAEKRTGMTLASIYDRTPLQAEFRLFDSSVSNNNQVICPSAF